MNEIQRQVKNIASKGRYGDSMLMHVNPAEVRGLASAMPLTINPETGQPEAFLPFLAPLLGSALGTSLLTGIGAGGILGATGMSAALASGLGAGLATYAQTGGSGSKALLSGLTAGFGTNAANTAAQSAATDAATQANIVAGMTPEVASTAAQQAALSAPRAATGTFDALKDTFMSGPDGTFAFDQGAKALASGAASPSGMLAATAAGGRGIIESQEAFERMLGESEEEYRRRRQQNLLDNPEPILYSAEGGRTGYYEGGRFGDLPDNIGGELPQIFAPARQAYEVNPNFMAGFSPETMYFNPATISAPASGLRAGAPSLGEDTYEGSKGGYGGRQASIAPQTTIDPYSAYTGSAPKGLEFTETPMPVQPLPELPVQPILPPDFGIGLPDFGGGINIPNIGNIDFSGIDFKSLIDQYGIGEFDSKNILDQLNIPEKEIVQDPVIDLDFGWDRGLADLPKDPVIDTDFKNDPNLFNPDGTPKMATSPDFLDFYNRQGEDLFADLPKTDLAATIPAIETLAPDLELKSQVEPDYSEIFKGLSPAAETLAPASEQSEKVNEILESMGQSDDQYDTLDLVTQLQIDAGLRNADGTPVTNTEKQPAPLAIDQGLQDKALETQLALETASTPALSTIPQISVQEALLGMNTPRKLAARPRNLSLNRAVGGETNAREEAVMDINNDPLTQEVTKFILGENENEEALNMFIDKYGSEVFMQLRQQVLESIVPDAQTEGLIRGDGEGGMDDDLRGMIGDKERIAVSQDEFIVPADVVSMLGDGSSDAGSKELYNMMDRVRQAKTGGTTQAPRINVNKVLPA